MSRVSRPGATKIRALELCGWAATLVIFNACDATQKGAPERDAAACASDARADAGTVARDAGSYGVVHGWPALADGQFLGQVSGVAIDSHGDVFVFHRADRPWLETINTELIAQPALLRLDAATGRIDAAFGAGQFVVPHGLRIDADDHLWVTDVGLHQVFELNREGDVQRAFGVAGEAGDDARHFNQPTDVAVAADGTFYVADGYGNSRVVAFSRQGEFLRAWGSYGTGPGQFDTPHSIALDAAGRILVADRGNARVQRFDTSGTWLGEWKSADLGRPWAVAIARDGSVFVVDGGDQNPAPPDRGRLMRLDAEGNLLEKWSSFGHHDGQIYWGHAVAIASDGALYVGDVGYGMRVQKFTRH